MSQFKFELWPIENTVVVTRPVKIGTDADGQDILKNSSVSRDDMFLAIKEVQVALDTVKAHYTKLTTQKR